MKLSVLPGGFSVCHLDPKTQMECPEPADFVSLSRTRTETSLVCREGKEPVDATVNQGWRIISILGKLEFGMTGILSAIASILAAGKISLLRQQI